MNIRNFTELNFPFRITEKDLFLYEDQIIFSYTLSSENRTCLICCGMNDTCIKEIIKCSDIWQT